MDLAEQLAAVWARRIVVLGAALLVAGAVFGWRAAGPETYRASTTLQVRLPDTDAADPGTRADYYADTVIGLMKSRDVVADALTSVGSSEDPVEVAERLTVQSGTQPGFVEVTAEGGSAGAAVELADALVAAVDRRVAADQAADVEAERARLSASLEQVLQQLYTVPAGDNAAKAALIREREELVSALRSNADRGAYRVATVESAEPPEHPVAPTPLRDALLAFLVALVLVAEGIVVRRAWRRAVSARDPGGDVAEAVAAPAVVLRGGEGMEAVAPLLPGLLDCRRVSVVQVGRRRPDARAAALIAQLLAARGRDVLLVDGSPRRPSVHRALGLDLDPGLGGLASEPLAAERLPAELRALPRWHGVRVLTAGRPANPDGTPPRARVRRVLEAAGESCVVLCLSGRRLDQLLPLLPEGPADPLVAVVHGASATRPGLHRMAAALRGLGLRLAGAVVRVRR